MVFVDKGTAMKKAFLHGISYDHTNRGVQALSYGSIDFILEKVDPDVTEIVTPIYYYRKKNKKTILIPHSKVAVKIKYFWFLDILISLIALRVLGNRAFLRVLPFAKELSDTEYIFNISGGDSFSDIYGLEQFSSLAIPSILAVFIRKKLILLPQTIGPFAGRYITNVANYILRGASRIYIRDDKFIPELEKMRLPYLRELDVSFYLHPQPVHDFTVDANSVGINVSGLAYYNKYKDLTGRFPLYKELIIKLIEIFQAKNKNVYLLPHTYDYSCPEVGSDDLSASKEIFDILAKKNNVVIVDRDLNAAQLKYLISQFDFFIGTRMHACFAAIFTETPVFGLAYSYKFAGSFDKCGLPSSYESVLDLDQQRLQGIADKISFMHDQLYLSEESALRGK